MTLVFTTTEAGVFHGAGRLDGFCDSRYVSPFYIVAQIELFRRMKELYFHSSPVTIMEKINILDFDSEKDDSKGL